MIPNTNQFLALLKKDFKQIQWTGFKANPAIKFEFCISNQKPEIVNTDKSKKAYCFDSEDGIYGVASRASEYNTAFGTDSALSFDSYRIDEDIPVYFIVTAAQQA